MASKKPESVFKTFAHTLGDGDLNFLCSRLHYRYQDDFAEALNYLDTLKMDENELNPASYALSNAKNCDEFDKLTDMLTYFLLKEYDKRGFRAEQLV